MDRLPAAVEQQCAASRWDFSDLTALYINCTLKRSPEVSNTRGLADLSIAMLERNGVDVTVVRAVDHAIATGVWPDMTEHGWERDDWPAPGHGQRGRRQALRDERPLLAPAPRLHDPAAGRCGLDR
jgi:hypothetical protein